MHRRTPIGALVGACLWASPAGAAAPGPQVLEITYDRALALARSAPALEAARARVAEAERGVDAAGIWPHNPQLSARAGPRIGPGGTTMDGFVALEQWLELGGQRGARIDAARAGAEAAEARRADAGRRLLREVGLSFAGALYWSERVELAQENLRITDEIARVARRRHEVGDVGGLEAAVAELAVVRARGELDRARAARARAAGRLAMRLGLEPSVQVRCEGDLAALAEMPDGHHELDDRPDLRAIGAEASRAEAEARLGRARRIPNVSVGAQYVREERADIVRGTLGLTLPVFDRGQGEAALADARKDRLRAELDAAARSAALEVRSLHTTAGQLTEAARRYRAGGLDTMARVQAKATQSYEAGAVPLGEVLSVRRELVLAKVGYADLRFEAAVARIELAASTGALQ